jgi:SAM-dependent methyltransferase
MLAMESSSEIGPWRRFRERWREERARAGAILAADAVLSDAWNYLLESTPWRRRQRYGDADFDWEFRVDTTAATVGSRARLTGALAGGPYQPIPPDDFRESMQQLAIDYAQFTFVDLGCGKGRALLLASDHPFRRIVGVEFLPELHRVALENISKYKSETQKCWNIEAVCGDARTFEFPAGPLVAFFFNPFPGAVFDAVLNRLKESLRRQPRPAWIVYHNPVREAALRERSLFEKAAGTRRFVIYRARTG